VTSAPKAGRRSGQQERDGDLGRDDADASRFLSEGGEDGALAPFAGQRQDRHDREQDGQAHVGEAEVAGVGLLDVCRGEQRHQQQRRRRGPDQGEQPAGGAGVGCLSPLHAEQPAERDAGDGGRRRMLVVGKD
jgi:hypothetical protein